MYDFANLLFAGPCSARCYFCIGQQIDRKLNQPNLDRYPLPGLDKWVEAIWQERIPQVIFTGSNTDPQLYLFEARLLADLRQRLPPEVQFSLHTNGRQALHKIALFNQYDRAAISFPSFDPDVYIRMMGVPRPPDLEGILTRARIPVKLSCLVDENNAPQMGAYLQRCQELGVRRVALRKLYGDRRSWNAWFDPAALGWEARGSYRGNPVFDWQGMEVTLWDFALSESRSLNLFADGTLSTQYLLTSANAISHQAQKKLSNCTALAPASNIT